MSSQTMETVLEEMINHKPGITSAQLFEGVRAWYGKLWDVRLTVAFERALWSLRDTEKYRVTNKQWYPKGHVAEPKRHGPKKEDPRQTRMFG